MNFKIKKNIFYLILFFSIISIFTAFQAEIVGNDASRYYNKFLVNVTYDRVGNKYEIGYEYFTYLIGIISSSKIFFYYVISFTISLFVILAFHSLQINRNFSSYILFASLLLFSSWYITEIANGIRQGFSLAIMYYAICSQLRKFNYLKFSLLFFLSTSFHLSTFLALPFLILMILNLKYVFFIWCLTLAFYIININEYIIKFISELLNLKVYNHIKFVAGGGTDRWENLQWDFLIYTVFFGLIAIFIFYSSKMKKFIYQDKLCFEFVIKVYLVLSITYFVFGFGPYSNRVAIICWFFIPILQSTIISQFRLSFESWKIITLTLPFFAINYFLFERLDLLNLNQ